MSNLDLHGPALTYITDEDLDRAEHERVLGEVLSCAGAIPLRVAFRLPRWSESDFLSLLQWYVTELDHVGATSFIDAPLVHERPEAADQFPGTQLWLPWRNRDLVRPSDVGNVAISVHSVEQAHEAVSVGATELIFGHVFTSESHPGEPGRGSAALQELVDAMQVYQNPPRITAIGGIDEHTIPEIGRIRHHSVACMRIISRSPDIALSLERIRLSWVAARINADLDDHEQTPFGNPSSIFF